MIILVDHNMEGQAVLLRGTLATDGWLALLNIHIITFRDVGLPVDSNDRQVWRFVQAQRMILLTGNRTMHDSDSLEQTLRDENTSTTLPIITVASVDRLDERIYRERCSSRLVEILIDIDLYLGVGRLFIL